MSRSFALTETAAVELLVEMVAEQAKGLIHSAESRKFVAPLALAGIFGIIHFVTWYSPWMGWVGYILVASAAVLVMASR